jgi:hypothetical protein
MDLEMFFEKQGRGGRIDPAAHGQTELFHRSACQWGIHRYVNLIENPNRV